MLFPVTSIRPTGLIPSAFSRTDMSFLQPPVLPPGPLGTVHFAQFGGPHYDSAQGLICATAAGDCGMATAAEFAASISDCIDRWAYR